MSEEFDVTAERHALGQALLAATASTAGHQEADVILRAVCDALVTSSEHVKLAWTIVGNLDVEILHPEYAAGPLAGYAELVQIGVDPAVEYCPVRDAVNRRETVTRDIAPGQGPLGDFGVRSVVSLPVGNHRDSCSGIVTLYADHPGYFDLVGTALFSAFIHLANASLNQGMLLSELTHMATHDQLTGLLNRRGIHETLKQELSRSIRNGKPFSIILLDIDRFKLINDRFGHQQGDAVLKAVADMVRDTLRLEDRQGRWGGEEFICIVPEADRKQVFVTSERIRYRIKDTPIAVATSKLNVTSSFGTATCPDDGNSLDKLVAAADAALYQAKRAGRDRSICAHTVQHDVHRIGNMLEDAIEEGRIVPAYQPIVDLRTGEVIAEETLARLITTTGEIIPAAQFIEAAHQLQLLHRIDQAIVKQAFSHCVTGLTTGINRLNHFVNISADLLRHRELVDDMLETARMHCGACGALVGDVKPMIIEITERELLTDIQTARALLEPFIEFGMRLALDDFGSGYSSYQYLADLPVQFLKIDGELIKRLREPKVRAIVQGIQDTAKALEITTVAEYVEDGETEAVLKEIGIDWGQGYYYGKPTLVNYPGPASCLQARKHLNATGNT